MKKTIAFVCIHNSCRSQMAEGYLKLLGDDVAITYSAGTENYPAVKSKAIEAMTLDGVDISAQYPKLLSDIPSKIDILITMGCGVTCPYVPCDFREDWGLSDPSGGSIKDFIVTRDIIKEKVEELLERIKKDELTSAIKTDSFHLA